MSENANDWQLIYTRSDWSIGVPQCLQGLGDPLCLLAGLIGRSCLRISVNTPPVKFTASDNPLNRNRPPLCSALLCQSGWFSAGWRWTAEKSHCLQRLSRMRPITTKPLCFISWCLRQARPSKSSPPASQRRPGLPDLVLTADASRFKALASNWLGNQKEEGRVMTKQHFYAWAVGGSIWQRVEMLAPLLKGMLTFWGWAHVSPTVTVLPLLTLPKCK